MVTTTRRGAEHPRDCPKCKSHLVFTFGNMFQSDVSSWYCPCPECGHHIVIATVELPPSWERLITQELG